MTRTRGGAFRAGDRVQLTDPKGRHFSLVLERGQSYHTHRGAIAHDKLIGAPEGSVVHSAANTPYLALRPLLPADLPRAHALTQAIRWPTGSRTGASRWSWATAGTSSRATARSAPL